MTTRLKERIAPLKYKRAIINFTYSFSWDVTQCDFDQISKDSKAKKVHENKDVVADSWLELFLFNRPVSWADQSDQASYHPNIISQNLRVLQKFGEVDKNATIIIPINKDPDGRKQQDPEEIKARLNYALRIYENGSGNCTLTFVLDNDVSFEKIHWILHLASSVSYIQDDLQDVKHLTLGWLQPTESSSSTFFPEGNKVTLTEVFSCIVERGILFPPIWKRRNLWFDKKVIGTKGNDFHNWQSPYVTTFLETDEKSFEMFEKKQEPEHVKEVGSIACRFSLDNGLIHADIGNLKREYIFGAFGFYLCPGDEQGRIGPRLKNYSHHSDLFYTIGKRGAVALSPDFAGNPSYFVLPTFLNLIEILRSRWHLGSVVNLKLDELLEKISHTDKLDELQDKIFRCKVLYGLFLKNPAPYLFDGGAITEIAEAGESIFWLDRLSVEMEKKFSVIEKLVDDIYSRQRFKEVFG